MTDMKNNGVTKRDKSGVIVIYSQLKLICAKSITTT